MHATKRLRRTFPGLFLLLLVCAAGSARAQQHLIGELTAVDAATGRVTVKSEGGATTTFVTDEKTVFRRVPPGQTTLENAERITRADLAVGDRVLVPNGAPAAGQAARQLIVMSRAALAETGERSREDWRRRGVAGRVVSADAAKSEVVIETRAPDGVETLTVAAAPGARVRRYAPDSLRPADAVAGSFADIRAGDQLRALGDRSADGRRLTAEEIISGSVARMAGVIASVDAARGEVLVKGGLSGEETVAVALGARTVIRRVPADFAETLRARREERRERSAQSGEGPAVNRPEAGREEGERRRERRGRRGEGGARRADGGLRGGGGLQQMLESLPAVGVAELKAGDAVLVTGTAGADASRVTAATVLTGGSDVLALMRRLGGGQDGRGNMSPGLPGSVMGGGTGGDRDEPRD
jgi:hypothetical protein